MSRSIASRPTAEINRDATDQIGHSLARGRDTRWGSREHLAIDGAPQDIQHDIARCRNCGRLLSLGIVTDEGTLSDMCWQCTVAVGAT
eukprot:4511070-Pyramimonas_sp.AAC.1